MIELSRYHVHLIAESIQTPLPPIEFARLLITVNTIANIAREEGYLAGLIGDPEQHAPDRPDAAPDADLPQFVRSCSGDCTETSLSSPPAAPVKPSARPTKKTRTLSRGPKATAKAARKGEPWTPAECRQALSLKAEGRYPSEIARQLNRPSEGTRAMIKRLEKAGVTVDTPDAEIPCGPRPDLWTEADDAQLADLLKTHSARDIAEIMGRTIAAVSARAKRFRTKTGDRACMKKKPWTDDEQVQLIEMADAGIRHAEIAKRMGRSLKSVDVRLGRLRRGELPMERPAAPVEKPAPVVPPAEAILAPVVPDAPVTAGRASFVRSTDLPQSAARSLPSQPCARASGLTARQRSLVAHLDRLDDDFGSSDDLQLINWLAAGVPVAQIAEELGCDRKAVIDRFKAMKTDEIVVAKTGALTIDGQRDLILAAQWRANRDGAGE